MCKCEEGMVNVCVRKCVSIGRVGQEMINTLVITLKILSVKNAHITARLHGVCKGGD